MKQWITLWLSHFLKSKNSPSNIGNKTSKGEFYLLIKELHTYPDCFQVYFWMSLVQFYTLLARIEHIKKKNTDSRLPVDPPAGSIDAHRVRTGWGEKKAENLFQKKIV